MTAVAVALAESRGDPKAKHTNANGSVDVGLWQINLRAHPQYTQAQMLDPQQNAGAMSSISKTGTDWSAWSTFRSGAYKSFEDRARTAAEEVGLHPDDEGVLGLGGEGSNNPVAVAKNAAEAIGQGVQVIVDAGKWLTDVHNIARVLYVVGGVALGLVAISIVAKPAVTDVVNTVKP